MSGGDASPWLAATAADDHHGLTASPPTPQRDARGQPARAVLALSWT